MKTRIGFVSNSSSCSFLIYGVCLKNDDKQHVLEKEDLFVCGQDMDNYAGRSWDEVKDDETGKQFKERVEKEIKEILGDELKFGTYSDAWYSG